MGTQKDEGRRWGDVGAVGLQVSSALSSCPGPSVSKAAPWLSFRAVLRSQG